MNTSSIKIGILAAACACSLSAFAAGKVLIVQSYHEGHPWVDAVNASVKKTLAGTGAEVEIFCMDAKRHSQEAEKLKAAQAARDKVASFKPDVVITSDDIAQSYFAKEYVGKAGPQFVFCGVNAEASAYGYPAANVTGILERPHFNETMKLLKTIRPNATTIAIVSDDSETSKWMLGQMQAAQDSAMKIVSSEQASLFTDWQAAVTKAQGAADAVVINLYHTVKKEAGGASMDPKEVMAWTLANVKKPTVGFFDFAIKDGVVLGIVESGEEHGYEAALMAKEILGGKTAKDLPIKTAKKGLVMINVVTAQKAALEIPFESIQAADLVIDK
ncbi:MAG: hypothetical protein H7Y43_11080 [Akkermansiaceae bacterium]|nr:hypothetical protein [Verrucomicrobiales bacterium]